MLVVWLGRTLQECKQNVFSTDGEHDSSTEEVAHLKQQFKKLRAEMVSNVLAHEEETNAFQKVILATLCWVMYSELEAWSMNTINVALIRT